MIVRLLKNLVPWVSFDLRELEFSIIWIHALYFFSSWRPQYLIMQPKLSEMTRNKRSMRCRSNKRVNKYLTLIISTSWSTPLSPGKSGCTRSNAQKSSENATYAPSLYSCKWTQKRKTLHKQCKIYITRFCQTTDSWCCQFGRGIN